MQPFPGRGIWGSNPRMSNRPSQMSGSTPHKCMRMHEKFQLLNPPQWKYVMTTLPANMPVISLFEVWRAQKERACFSFGNELSRQKITQIEAPPLLLCPPYYKKAYCFKRFTSGNNGYGWRFSAGIDPLLVYVRLPFLAERLRANYGSVTDWLRHYASERCTGKKQNKTKQNKTNKQTNTQTNKQTNKKNRFLSIF